MVQKPACPDHRDLLSTADLSESEIREFLGITSIFLPYTQKGESIPLLQGKTIVNLFLEDSTRTRASFELATRRLGGSSLNFSPSTSSLNKGESLIDTAQNIEVMRPHALIVRHPSAGSPAILAAALKVPVINAGDGFHEHPTQALLDAFTLEARLGSLKGKKILIVGDIAHSRVARSNIRILNKLGASVTVCGPPTLLPPKPEVLGVKFSYLLDEVLPEADVVMTLRIQFERHGNRQVPSVREYRRFWGLTQERESLMKPEAVILDPGPVNRGIQLDPELADGPRSLILEQVSNGVVLRMAVLAKLCNPTGLASWLDKGGHRV